MRRHPYLGSGEQGAEDEAGEDRPLDQRRAELRKDDAMDKNAITQP